jgi:hypothetical protein
MAYFTGRDVRLWVTTEHPDDGIRIDGTAPGDQLITYPDADASTNDPNAIFTGLDAAGLTAWMLSDITSCDVTVGAQDEDISFMGLRNVGKLEVKKDTSVSITRKKSDVKFTMLFQGKTNTSHSNGDGKHGARYGLINSGGMMISDGTTDPKTTLDDAGTAKQCFGYRVFVELKPESSADAGDGEVLVIPNCMFSEYTHTVSNESANEESFTMTSQVKPFIYNGTKSGGAYTGLAVTQTATALM